MLTGSRQSPWLHLRQTSGLGDFGASMQPWQWQADLALGTSASSASAAPCDSHAQAAPSQSSVLDSEASMVKKAET